MVVDSLHGEPAEFSEELQDPESDDYKRATEALYPFVSMLHRLFKFELPFSLIIYEFYSLRHCLCKYF